jgi:nucleotide-binding universal stress UspA family protein
MYETVVVPTDGSDHAARAGSHGAALARRFDAQLRVLGVVDDVVFDDDAGGRSTDAGATGESTLHQPKRPPPTTTETDSRASTATETDSRASTTTETDIERATVTRQSQAGGVVTVPGGTVTHELEAAETAAVERVAAAADRRERVTAAVRHGDPRTQIVEYATETDADLVVMGTHGRSGVERVLLGSVTEYVVRHGPTPVVVVHADHALPPPSGYHDVLVAADGTRRVDAVLDDVFGLAARFDARVHVVSVVDTSETGPLSKVTGRHSRARRHDIGVTATERVATRARKRGFDVETTVETGVPAEELLAYADAHDVDLIGMTAGDRTGVGRLLLGSTTDRVLRRSPTPVLVR